MLGPSEGALFGSGCTSMNNTSQPTATDPVSGQAYYTGQGEFWAEAQDPLGEGFFLPDSLQEIR